MNIPRDTLQNQRRGVISLLALIIMAAITSIAVGASIITITELRQSETIGQSFVAAYAAESGMENGLYTIKINRISNTVSATVDELDDTAERHVAVGASATWHRSATPSLKSIQIARLNPDQSVALDFYDPDDFTTNLNHDCNTTNPPCATNLYVTWEDNCNGFSWLEVTATDLSSLFGGSPIPTIGKTTQACNCTGDACKNYSGTTGHQTCTPKLLTSFTSFAENGDLKPIEIGLGSDRNGLPMRFTFRPMVPISATNVECTIENLTAEIHDDHWGDHDDPLDYYNYYKTLGWSDQKHEQYHSDHTKDLPAHITITSIGAFGNTRQALTATVPWKAPVSGLLNFVLFSDQDIMK